MDVDQNSSNDALDVSSEEGMHVSLMQTPMTSSDGINDGDMEPAVKPLNVSEEKGRAEENEVTIVYEETQILSPSGTNTITDEDSGSASPEQHQSLQDIKAAQLATTHRMNLLISKVEEEFDNEILRIHEETERAVKEVRAYGEQIVTHIQNQRNAFATAVKAGMTEFQNVSENIARNTQRLEFIQSQFSNTLRETGL